MPFRECEVPTTVRWTGGAAVISREVINTPDLYHLDTPGHLELRLSGAAQAHHRALDLGRRIERALNFARLLRTFATEEASANDLTALLELGDVQISYRQRYATGLALMPVRDLVGLDPFNPRSISFPANAIREHLDALPRLKDDGMAEPQQAAATGLVALISTLSATMLTAEVCDELEGRLFALSDAISERFFLRGSETLRASGMTLA